ncbi:hypothetical protein JNW90_28075 [Micromonospora sp. STR1s_5]|nr:hypothetical protein [Micromonospora sp. STR1s_5]
MDIRLIAKFDENERGLVARFLARCQELELTVSEGDVDGRRWLEVDGVVDEDGLVRLVLELRPRVHGRG